MVRQMTATQVKTHLLALLDDVAGGESIEVTRHGRTIARIVPAQGPQALQGRFAGVAVSAAADEALFTTGAEWDLS